MNAWIITRLANVFADTGRHTAFMSHIETGNTKLSLQVLVSIADALDVQTDALIFDEPKSGKPKARERIHNLLDSCTEEQTLVLVETMESLKTSLDKHIKE